MFEIGNVIKLECSVILRWAIPQSIFQPYDILLGYITISYKHLG
jgi:hypothetical protein